MFLLPIFARHPVPVCLSGWTLYFDGLLIRLLHVLLNKLTHSVDTASYRIKNGSDQQGNYHENPQGVRVHFRI